MDTELRKKIDTFFSSYPLHHIQKGQIIIQADEAPKGVYYLLDGRIRQYDITPSGDEVVVNIFQPPAFFPMSWAINNTQNHYFFEAIVDTSYRLAPASQVVSFLKDNPDVMYNLLSRLYSGVDGMQRRMAYLMGSTAYYRILYELKIESLRFGTVRADGYHLLLNETELAQRAGVTRETANRELQKIHKKGIITVQHRTLIVNDLQLLEEALAAES